MQILCIRESRLTDNALHGKSRVRGDHERNYEYRMVGYNPGQFWEEKKNIYICKVLTQIILVQPIPPTGSSGFRFSSSIIAWRHGARNSCMRNYYCR